MVVQIGETISHYRILEKLGEGGMGVVYKAEDTKLKRLVALKFLTPQALGTEEEKTRFLHEAQAAAALSHSNICTVYEIDESEGRSFIAMEYIEGESLKEKVQTGPLKLYEVMEIVIQVSEGLQKAHEQGVVHRDIKSANIMVTEEGQAKIMDFGLAKLVGRTKITKTGSTMGTVAYMSPEQTRGEEIDHRTDIWSLGVVLYEMVTGQLPFKGDYEQAVVYSIMNEQPEPMTGLRTGVPMKLERVVSKTLAKSADERHQHTDDLLVDLRTLQNTLESDRDRRVRGRKIEAEALGKRVTWVRPMRRWITIAAPMALTLVAIAVYLTFREGTPRPAADRKMLVVLPFKNLGLPADEYFADGVTDEISARLAGILNLGVIGRPTYIHYKNSNKTVGEIGDELGVDYILGGTVRWARTPPGPSRVRVTPALIQVSDATQLWATVYDQDLADIFVVQTDIAQKVVEALNITLHRMEREILETRPTDNLTAYDSYLRGNNQSNTAQGRRIAVQMYENAVKQDPNFALAYAALSQAHTDLYWTYDDPSEERRARAKEAVDRAFEIQPDLPQAHKSLGYYFWRCHSDYDRALEEFAIAQKRLPNDVFLFGYTIFVQLHRGELEQALENLKQGLKINPRCYGAFKIAGEVYGLAGRYPEAKFYYDRCISLDPETLLPYIRKAELHLKSEGSTEKARSVLDQARQTVGEEGRHDINITLALLDLFDGEYARALDRLDSVPSEAYETQFHFIPKDQLYAQIYGLMGQRKLEHDYYDSALEIVDARVRVRPEDTRLYSALGIAYAGLGRWQEALRQGKSGTELLPSTDEAHRDPFRVKDLARIHVMLGDYDAAIDQLESLRAIPGVIPPHLLQLDPVWAPLHDHPRFKNLIEEG